MQEAAAAALVQRQTQLVLRSAAAAAAADGGVALLAAAEGGGGVAALALPGAGAWECLKVPEGFGLEISSRLKWRQTQTHGAFVRATLMHAAQTAGKGVRGGLRGCLVLALLAAS
jgi:hypothetical protein